MSHHGRYGRLARAAVKTPVAVGWALTIAILLSPPVSLAQQPGPAVKPNLQPAEATAVTAPRLQPAPVFSQVAPPATPTTPPGAAVVTIDGETSDGGTTQPPALPSDVQVVRFQGPPGLTVEVLAPSPTPVATSSTSAGLTIGLKRGIGYRLRLSNIPERPGVELFPVIEIVGHLHRPDGIDPGKYPIRVIFTSDDLDPVLDLARLVTKVIYLEDPEQALPIRMPKDQIPVVTLNPTEQPLRVASALGRPIAIVRVGGRRPTVEEIGAGATGDLGLDYAATVGGGRCPFTTSAGEHCSVPCGPPCATPPPPQPRLPQDEYLCDGGDHGMPASPIANGGVGGIEPRDAVVRFDIGLGDRVKPRVLPTNVVCVYAPRFAEVRVTTGANETVDVKGPKTGVLVQAPSHTDAMVRSRRLVQNQSPELSRNRERPTGVKGRLRLGEESDRRIVAGTENASRLMTGSQKQSPEIARNRQTPGKLDNRLRLDAIKTSATPVVTGIVEGASEAVKVWGPQAVTGIETPPDRPGLAVIKRVTPGEAEPGDTLTFTITYRNMGNTPIRSVAIVDSLLPRIEYVKGTSRGPVGTDFSAAANRTGSTELRWVLSGAIRPGASGQVSFQAIVR